MALFLGRMLLSDRGRAGTLDTHLRVPGCSLHCLGHLLLNVYNLTAGTQKESSLPCLPSGRLRLQFWLDDLGGGRLLICQPFRQYPARGSGEYRSRPPAFEPLTRGETRLSWVRGSRPAAPSGYTNNWGSRLLLLAPIALVWAASTRGAKREIRHRRRPVSADPDRPITQPWPLDQLGGRLHLRSSARRSPGPGPDPRLPGGGGRRDRWLGARNLANRTGSRSGGGRALRRRAAQPLRAKHRGDRRLPLVGYGGPIEDPEKPDRARRHPRSDLDGDILHGIPAAIAFVGFLVYAMVATRRGPPAASLSPRMSPFSSRWCNFHLHLLSGTDIAAVHRGGAGNGQRSG